jgi:hypothetical protein
VGIGIGRRGPWAIAVACALAGLGIGPGAAQVLAAQDASLRVDGARIFEDVQVLAHDSLQGRAAGSRGGEMARRYIVRRLEELGFAPALDTFPVVRRGAADTLTGVNVQVTVPGFLFPDRWMVLTAHYDHVGVRDGEIFNGADDNASGTAALLALSEYLRAHPPRHSVLLAFLDAEEGGLRGARHLVSESLPGPQEGILVNVNMDMVGHSDGELWVTGTTPYPSLRPVVEVVTPAPPVYLLFGHDTERDTGSDNWINASDHAAFHRAGIPFLYFGVADHPDYHRPTDDPETLNPGFLTGATETILRVVERLDEVLGGARPGA